MGAAVAVAQRAPYLRGNWLGRSRCDARGELGDGRMSPPAGPTDGPPSSAGPAALPRQIWALGLVSLLMDTSSEMIHSLLPVFLTTVLGAGPLAVGIVEGIAEATTAVVKLFSGLLSDRIGRRKPLVLLGYGLAALSKPVFALAPTVIIFGRCWRANSASWS